MDEEVKGPVAVPDKPSETVPDEVDEQVDMLDKLFEDENTRKIGAKLLPLIAAKANAKAEANKARELDKFLTELRAKNAELMQEKMAELTKQFAPTDPAELQKILEQEYTEFTLKLPYEGKSREFVIRELPVVAENKLIKTLQKTLSARLVDLANVDWNERGTMLERIQQLAAVVPGALETLADCCAVVLDPLGKSPEITGEWVLNNMGMSRISKILMCQLEAGKYRDFFSLISSNFRVTRI